VEVSVVGRVLLVAVGAVVLLVGLGVLAIGALVLFLTGRDSAFPGGSGDLHSDSYALVSDAAGLRAIAIDDTARVRVRSTGGPVFVGVGPAETVRPYLAGVAYDELTDVRLAPLEATLLPSDGTGAPARPGADRSVWTVTAAGPGRQTVDIDLDSPDEVLVVMNADGSAGVDVTASVAIVVPVARSLGIGFLVGGAVAAPVGGVLLATGIRRSVRARAE
jgi:hypothetical protein